MPSRPSVLRLPLAAATLGLLLPACAPDPSPARSGGSDSQAGGGIPLTLENILRDRRGGVSEAAISPDGRWIALTARGPDGAGIYLLDLTEEPPVPRYWLAGSRPAWAPDSGDAAFFRDGDLWRAPVGDPDAVRLTDGLSGVRTPAWAPDGVTIAVMAAASGSQDVWLVPADEPGAPRQLTFGAMSADEVRFGVSWSPGGGEIAYISNRARLAADDVWIVDVGTGAERRLTRTVRAISPAPAWSPDGSRLAVLGVRNDEYWYLDISDLYLLDPAGGGPEEPLPMSGHATGYRFQPMWSAEGDRIAFTLQERGEHHLWSVPVTGGVATRFTHLGGVFGSVTADAAPTRFAFVRSAPGEGPDLYVVPASGGPPDRLTRFAPEWADVRPPQEISFRSFDGHSIQGFLYLSPDAEAGAICPALVQVHGGGTNSYLDGPNLIEQYLASQGFVVLAINYRGGSGFGREFQDLGDEDWLNGQALDPGAAADWLREQPFVSDRVGIYGYSYGGMQSMAAITRTPDKFDAAAPMAGIYSQRLTFEHQDRLGRIFTIDGHGGRPEERPEIYDKTETLARIGNITAPVLIQHGELDVRAPFVNFQLAVEAFEEHGIEYEAHTYPEGHGFRDPENRIALYRRVEDFFVRHLGGCFD